MKQLTLRHIGQIREASLRFGDLTVLVGPQATGKSITLQWLKLLTDTGLIQSQLDDYGLDYAGQLDDFLDLYFGEGMRSLWLKNSAIEVDGRPVDLTNLVGRRRVGKKQTAFLVPAQRVLALPNGWPRPFQAYSAGDPFAVRAFSEQLRVLMEREVGGTKPLFPRSNRLKSDYRKLLASTVFGGFDLAVDKVQSQKRLVLHNHGQQLPFMVWSAGQREFVPLLLGLYWLMPPSQAARRADVQWALIEELEMGLHPNAITAVLLIIIELLVRGYRVVLSTHSPQVLELVWALSALKSHGARPSALLDLFAAPHSQGLMQMAKQAVTKSARVYYYDPDGSVRDISALDPTSSERLQSSWGGLLDFSARANATVADAVANDPAYAVPGSVRKRKGTQ